MEVGMKTLDLKKELRYLYFPPARKVEAVRVPRLKFAMIDGRIESSRGPSTSPVFQEAMMALYGVAYTLKFTLKKRPQNPVDFPIMALEGLWWVEDGVFDIAKPDNWFFTLMMLLPNLVSRGMFETAIDEVKRKRGETPSLRRLQLEYFAEGLCMQVMHVGPYREEPVTVQLMRDFAASNGYVDLVGRGGKHHEIYMGDPRRANPAKLKTVLRHPIRKVASWSRPHRSR
jgi:hypothetical protein